MYSLPNLFIPLFIQYPLWLTAVPPASLAVAADNTPTRQNNRYWGFQQPSWFSYLCASRICSSIHSLKSKISSSAKISWNFSLCSLEFQLKYFKVDDIWIRTAIVLSSRQITAQSRIPFQVLLLHRPSTALHTQVWYTDVTTVIRLHPGTQGFVMSAIPLKKHNLLLGSLLTTFPGN